MITCTDINNLIAKWNQRMITLYQHQEYVDGVRDCIYDLNKMVTDSLEEEMEAYEAFMSEKIDEYNLNEDVAI